MNTFVIILLFFVLPLILFTGIILWIKSNKRSMYESGMLLVDEFDERFEKALVADAVVKSITDTKVMGDMRGKIKMDLNLEVYLKGDGCYEISTSWIVDVSAVSMVQPGETVSVKVDKDDKSKIYPGVNWAAYWLYS